MLKQGQMGSKGPRARSEDLVYLGFDFDHLSLFDVFFQVVVKWQGLQFCSGQDRSEGDRDDNGDNGDDSCQFLLKKAIISLTTTVLKRERMYDNQYFSELYKSDLL